jgi:hypothetical protein
MSATSAGQLTFNGMYGLEAGAPARPLDGFV